MYSITCLFGMSLLCLILLPTCHGVHPTDTIRRLQFPKPIRDSSRTCFLQHLKRTIHHLARCSILNCQEGFSNRIQAQPCCLVPSCTESMFWHLTVRMCSTRLELAASIPNCHLRPNFKPSSKSSSGHSYRLRFLCGWDLCLQYRRSSKQWISYLGRSRCLNLHIHTKCLRHFLQLY